MQEKEQVVIVDLDGTLCNIDHRLHYLKNNDWKSFFEGIPNDSVNDPVRNFVWLLRWQAFKVIFLSGRPEDYRKETEDWLKEHFGPYYALYMRGKDDMRRDDLVKRDLYEAHIEPQFDVYCVIDDRDSVCELWKRKGLFLFKIDRDEPDFRQKPKTKLHMMVGPSGSGKTTLAEQMFDRDMIVSSDRVRELILDDPTDMSQNDRVFKTVHSLVKHRVELGLETVVDATNIRNKDRTALVDLIDTDTPIVYHVVNRPVEEKIETGGWRNKINGLIERHDNTFRSNLKDILNGDGFDNVTVRDHRQ